MGRISFPLEISKWVGLRKGRKGLEREEKWSTVFVCFCVEEPRGAVVKTLYCS